MRSLFSKKTGKEKTVSMARNYCVTCSMFAIISVFLTFCYGSSSAIYNMLSFICLLLFGGYSFLSLRLRKIEEKIEEK